MVGGSGLNLQNGEPAPFDTAKMVDKMGSCASDAAAGGTAEVTDLGPNDAKGVSNATANFTFTSTGSYKLCYKVEGGSYQQVGTGSVLVKGVPPTSFIDNGGFIIGQAKVC